MRTPDTCYAFAARPFVTLAARNSRSGSNVCRDRAAIARHHPQGEMAMIRSTGSAAAAVVLLGAGFGGIAGADKHCQMLAAAAGAGNHTWHAYLSTQGPGAVNARDRIGKGPWRNARGVIIAKDVAELHGNNNMTKQTDLTEKGEVVNGRGD